MGIRVCSPWAERSQILDRNGKCPNDCVSVERCDAKCWDCRIGEVEGPTVAELLLAKMHSNPDRGGMRGVRVRGG